jgi:hypothetical protein
MNWNGFKKEAAVFLIDVLLQDLLGGTGGPTETLRMAGVPP